LARGADPGKAPAENDDAWRPVAAVSGLLRHLLGPIYAARESQTSSQWDDLARGIQSDESDRRGPLATQACKHSLYRDR
jgi:hypothetical protein